MNTFLVSTRTMAPRLLPGAFVPNHFPLLSGYRKQCLFQGVSGGLNDQVGGSGRVDNVGGAIYEEVKAKLEELITHMKSTHRLLSGVMKHPYFSSTRYLGSLQLQVPHDQFQHRPWSKTHICSIYHQPASQVFGASGSKRDSE